MVVVQPYPFLVKGYKHRDFPENWTILGELELSSQGKSYTEAVASLCISLVPHVHTTKCNRREFVCTAEGKFREREKLSLLLLARRVRCGSGSIRIRCFWSSRKGGYLGREFQDLLAAVSMKSSLQMTVAIFVHRLFFRMENP